MNEDFKIPVDQADPLLRRLVLLGKLAQASPPGLVGWNHQRVAGTNLANVPDQTRIVAVGTAPPEGRPSCLSLLKPGCGGTIFKVAGFLGVLFLAEQPVARQPQGNRQALGCGGRTEGDSIDPPCLSLIIRQFQGKVLTEADLNFGLPPIRAVEKQCHIGVWFGMRGRLNPAVHVGG